jgi:hypothetical protein
VKIDKNKIYKILFVISICISSLISYKLFEYNYKDKSFAIISNEKNIYSDDIQLSYKIDGEVSTAAFPNKDDGYVVTEVKCKSGVKAKWNNISWTLSVTDSNNNKNIICTIYFETNTLTLVEYITEFVEVDTTNLVYDDTDDKNIRYIGANPDNYLCFDKDCTSGKWRVIGVMNNIQTESNETQSLTKIIRDESIGNYVWNSYGGNNWKNASLQEYLNSGDWWTDNLLDYNNLIENVRWNIIALPRYPVTPLEMYILERNISETDEDSSFWIGKVGLMYPSDYGYATSGGDITDRATCLAKELYYWDLYSDCYQNDFLYLNQTQWLISFYNGNSAGVFYIHSSGYVGQEQIGYSGSEEVKPVLYLVSTTKILAGTGTSTDPWIIGL